MSVAALTGSVIQGLCTFVVVMNAGKLALGITSVAAAGGSSAFHSDAVRLTLRYVSALFATITLYVLWNGWRLRNRSSARWRKVPLSKREKRTIGFGLVSSVVSWILIVAEVFAHQRIYPR